MVDLIEMMVDTVMCMDCILMIMIEVSVIDMFGMGPFAISWI